LLSPTHAFSPLTDARALVLAGGTMSPFADYATHLFPTHPPAKVTTLSCAHVVPGENLFVWTLTRARSASLGSSAAPSSSSSEFDFTYARRGDDGMVRELGLALLNATRLVPDGVVVFFPSYGYLGQVAAKWRASGLWDQLAARKTLFCETRGTSAETEAMLREYAAAILDPPPPPPSKPTPSSSSPPPQGALLLSVVGGRLSEGINFSDRLGRAVFVVGLPYPNPSSPEWAAKSRHVEDTVHARLVASGGGGDGDDGSSSTLDAAGARARAKAAARDFYENACMRAVNQSVGRAIRHRGDYAAIVLVDRRYAGAGVRAKLSGWVRESVREGCADKGVAEMMGGLSLFFRGKKGK
jgi:chromosome transmission fidelity protein 1